MKQNEADLVLHLTGVRDAGSRPVKLLLRRPAIDVMAECKAFPRRPKRRTLRRGPSGYFKRRGRKPIESSTLSSEGQDVGLKVEEVHRLNGEAKIWEEPQIGDLDQVWLATNRRG